MKSAVKEQPAITADYIRQRMAALQQEREVYKQNKLLEIERQMAAYEGALQILQQQLDELEPPKANGTV